MSKEYDNEILDQETEELDDTLLDDENVDENEYEDENEDVDEDEKPQKTSGRKRLWDTLQIDPDVNASSLKEVIGSIQLNGEWFRKNMLFFFVLTLCLLAFVTNRYQAQQEMIEEAELKSELNEIRYIWLTRFSELTTAQRQSQIEERLKQHGDSTLQLSKEAPFIIKTDK